MKNDLEQKYVTKLYVHEYETDDSLGHQPMCELYGSEGFYETYDCTYINKGRGDWANGSAIKISEMEEQIAKIKAKGGTHLDIDYHCDHDSYSIYGVKISESTDEEIEEFIGTARVHQRQKLLTQKQLLEREIAEIDNKLNVKKDEK